MRLSELQPTFLRLLDAAGTRWQQQDEIADAQGLHFLCPVCFKTNGGAVGTHSVVCWSRSAGVPDDLSPGPGRWRITGTGLHDVSLMEEPGHTRSVLLHDGCGAHFFVTNGEVTF